MRLVLLALAGLFAVPCAAAQAALTVSPDTLFYEAEVEITLQNGTPDAVALDSVAVRFAGPRAYDLQVDWGPEPSIECGPEPTGPACVYLNPYYDASAALGRPVEAGDVAWVRVQYFDPCIVCRDGGMPADTLLVYSGGRAEADTVVIDLSRFVAAEDGPGAEPLVVVAGPNPTGGDVVLRLGQPAAQGGTATLVDALGREVARVAIVAGARVLRIPDAGLSPGLYVARVHLATGAVGTARVTVAR